MREFKSFRIVKILHNNAYARRRMPPQHKYKYTLYTKANHWRKNNIYYLYLFLLVSCVAQNILNSTLIFARVLVNTYKMENNWPSFESAHNAALGACIFSLSICVPLLWYRQEFVRIGDGLGGGVRDKLQSRSKWCVTRSIMLRIVLLVQIWTLYVFEILCLM